MKLNQKSVLDLVIVGVLITGVILVSFLLLSSDETANAPGSDSVSVGDGHNQAELSDLHGIAVDFSNENKLYLANHEGLYVLEDGEMTEVGNFDADIMGLANHPNRANVLFASGHPRSGGNLGLLKSEDGGQSWQKLSDGLDGPVDFHLIAIDKKDPNFIYGMHNKRIQKSLDGGQSWEYLADIGLDIYQITTGNTKNLLYLSTPAGVRVSMDGGENWENLSDDLDGRYVTTVAVNPINGKDMLSFSYRLGLARSSDGGKTWATLDENFKDDTVVFIEYAKNDPNIIYLSTESLKIYKSDDAGVTWNLVLEPNRISSVNENR